ncbi:DinB family protein [Fundidesulfovibrio terrae]|uniref:DinB family protein n=1 Tax=Fundidesulfovibrio terrae TaxID=2922866 RepID=UPI001FAEA9C4|nr:DinB family protein [Fundidesulfovibrio terrae]
MQDVRDCLDGLARVHSVLSSMVRRIPSGRVLERRGEKCWTILEHVGHLADVQPMLHQRIQRILNEDVPEFVPFLPAEGTYSPNAAGVDVETALARFDSGRRKQLEILRSMDPASWDRAAVHPEYTQYGLRILVRHILMHDYWHMYRIEELWLSKDEFLSF